MPVNLSAIYDAQCCISSEIGNFETGTGKSWANYKIRDAEDHADAAKKLLAMIVDDVKHGRGEYEGWSYEGQQVRYFWFKKAMDYKGNYPADYEFAELRAEVQNYPGVVKLGEYKNANTGNMCDGYMIVIDCEQGSEENYDD